MLGRTRRAMRSCRPRSSTAAASGQGSGGDAQCAQAGRYALPGSKLKLSRNFVNAGGSKASKSVTGDFNGERLKRHLASGVNVVQYNLLSQQ